MGTKLETFTEEFLASLLLVRETFRNLHFQLVKEGTGETKQMANLCEWAGPFTYFDKHSYSFFFSTGTFKEEKMCFKKVTVILS